MGFMGQTSCIMLGLEYHVWHMCNGINVMEYFKSGEQMRMMYYSVSDTGILAKKSEFSYQESNLRPSDY